MHILASDECTACLADAPRNTLLTSCTHSCLRQMLLSPPPHACCCQISEREERSPLHDLTRQPALQELLETAKASMRVPFRPDGPRMAYYFDARPQASREEGSLGKRKLVVDNYEVEPQPDGGFQAKRRPVFQRAVQVSLPQQLVVGQLGACGRRQGAWGAGWVHAVICNW